MIHIFNPEHDIALGAHVEQFTAPHAARQLRHDLGFLPMIWAEEGDKVIVEDIEAAKEAFRHLGLKARGSWRSWRDIADVLDVRQPEEIDPWGWDQALFHRMVKAGVSPALLPMPNRLEAIRQMSHRQWAAEHVLPAMRLLPNTVGKGTAVSSVSGLMSLLHDYNRVVVKAPWSSSGRGVRTISSPLASGMHGWIGHVIERQCCIMVEPYYQKVIDLGMEFQLNGDGSAHYEGLSLFDTANGAYTGNRIDSEEDKEAILFQYISPALWQSVKTAITALLHQHLAHYRGRLGIDMMVVSTDDGLRLHPCVEMNLRSTMGHVALQLHRRYGLQHQSMQITYDGRYHLLK